MPRVTAPKIVPEDRVPKKRAPRRRVTAELDTDESAVRPRRTAPRRKPPLAAVSETSRDDAHEGRRAPTPLRAERQASRHSAKVMGITMGVLAVTVGAGVLIGFSDKGPIDVVAVVNERNEKIGRGEVRNDSGESVTATIPVQNSDTRPNGGLVPADVPVSAEPVPAVATSSVASSTPDTPVATSESENQETTTSDAPAPAETPTPAP
jgi:hypothetical protein